MIKTQSGQVVHLLGGADMYIPPTQTFCCIKWYSITFIWLKLTSINELTQYLGFGVPLYLCIHDDDSKQAGCTPA